MIYIVHFTTPIDTSHEGVYFNPTMQEYEGKQVVKTKPGDPTYISWICTPHDWTPVSSRKWCFHRDWLSPAINLL